MSGGTDDRFWPEVDELDLCGLKCPLPALRTRRAVERMSPGERVVVRATDPLSVIDVPHAAGIAGGRVVRETSEGRVRSFWIERS